jgi:hypothetical protein
MLPQISAQGYFIIQHVLPFENYQLDYYSFEHPQANTINLSNSRFSFLMKKAV